MPDSFVTSISGLTLMPECRCRTDANDLRKKCRCRTNFFPAFGHSDIQTFRHSIPGPECAGIGMRCRNSDALPSYANKLFLIGFYHDITQFCFALC
jgi:hypothetical protein